MCFIGYDYIPTRGPLDTATSLIDAGARLGASGGHMREEGDGGGLARDKVSEWVAYFFVGGGLMINIAEVHGLCDVHS